MTDISNLTWNELFSRDYWDVKFISGRSNYGSIGYVISRQEYTTEECHKIIDKILENFQRAEKYDKLTKESLK